MDKDKVEVAQPEATQPTSKNHTKRFKTLLHFRRFDDGTLAPTKGEYYKDEHGCIRRQA